MTSDSDALTGQDPAASQVLDGEQPLPGAAGSGGDDAGAATGRRPGRRPRALTVVSVLAVALFALWGIGTPLVGNGSLTTTDKMVQFSPYAEAGFAGTGTSNMYLDDTFTSEFPSYILYKQALADGGPTAGQWDPYMSGGVPLAATPNYAMASPLSIPYYVLPTWLAPAYERLLEIIVAVGGCLLFLRRLGLSRPAALTAGLVYSTSAFMVVWLNFPQTRVAALIPALFWTLERYLQQRRLRDAALISLPVASLLLSGFPSVAGYALLTAAAYTVVRVAADHRGRLRRAWRPVAGTAAGAAAGIGLAAFQLLPFAGFLSSWYTQTRAQDARQHVDVTALLTAVAPWAFGTADPARLPLFYLGFNYVEFASYISAGAAVLVLVAFALVRPGRAMLPAGVWAFFTVAVLAWGELLYVGGWPLAVMQHAPGLRSLFAINYIGRSRSVVGFLLAVLTGIGFELLLRHRARRTAARSRSATRWAVGVGVTAAAFGGLLLWWGERRAVGQQALLRSQHDETAVVGLFWREMGSAGLLVLAAIACVVVLWLAAQRMHRPDYDRVWRKARFAAAAALPLIIAGQSASFVSLYYPNSPVSTFYPVTDTHSFLAANLGGQRYASSNTGMIFGANVAYGLRSVNGHAFINDNFTRLVKAVPGDPVPYGTYIDFAASTATAASPILDLLGTKYFVTEVNDPVLGTETDSQGDGSQLTLRPGQSVTAPVPVNGPVRGIGIALQGAIPASLGAADPNSWVEVALSDASGARVADSRRLTDTIDPTKVFTLPVTADAVTAGTQLTATVTLHAQAPLTIAAVRDSVPALSTVIGGDDGLRLVHVGTNAIYRRLNAQPRIRWAANSQVVNSRYQRVQLLASGQVGADSVVFSHQVPAASGLPAAVSVDDDGLDTIATTVNAQGAGYLVVADADQVGWTATVDGKHTPLLAADEGLVAVAVPAGKHTVTLRFWAPHGTIAYPLTIVTAVGLVAVVLGEIWWTRRRRRATKPPTAA
ncbi:YfhO family protein [Actinocrinis puniceicyclus]|uniref:YfhO family protein n=1 Tax=Actinocrinis puniceicyclus TaxID=977794 RepID=A0A8J7WUK4_9ACTN|nr:YfhO family protein [Actinocrinis puniceicyclus]MBS2965419.1 YfhO family protein [Actinocrinis puniceicyclus]